MRLPYVENPPKVEGEQDKAIVERVKERRGDAGLLELDLALLHAPPVADGWYVLDQHLLLLLVRNIHIAVGFYVNMVARNSFMGAIRTKTSLPTSIRELAISRVAMLNKAWYEWGHHAPLLQECDGIQKEHVDAVLRTPAHQTADVLDEKHASVMAYSDAMTLDVTVPEAVFERLKRSFSNREIVEITATIAAYNCVSRLLVALDVGEKNQEMPSQ
jgi:alkylhydroperoxidase family enzyme